MITAGKNNELYKKLYEYIVLRMERIYKKLQEPSPLVVGGITIAWGKKWIGDDFSYYQLQANARYERNLWNVPDVQFDEGYEFSPELWEFVKQGLDEVEKYILNLYKQAKENERALEEKLSEGEGYQEYLSLKIQKKLEDGNNDKEVTVY